MFAYRVRRGLGVLLLAGAMMIAAGGIAAAQTDGDTTYPTIPTTTTTDPCTKVNEGGVCGTVVVEGSSVSRSSLPFTGGDVALLTLVGLGAVGAGVTIVLVGRRRSTSSA
jgi:hypothetical protein